MFSALGLSKADVYVPRLNVNLENDQKGFDIDQAIEKEFLALVYSLVIFKLFKVRTLVPVPLVVQAAAVAAFVHLLN